MHPPSHSPIPASPPMRIQLQLSGTFSLTLGSEAIKHCVSLWWISIYNMTGTKTQNAVLRGQDAYLACDSGSQHANDMLMEERKNRPKKKEKENEN